MKNIFIALMMLVFMTPALAVSPDEMLKDSALEARAREISKNLRCLVCQGEAIDDSNADFAKDLRKIVRERLQAGDSDQQVMRYLQDRYGDFILLRPPLEQKTLLLWLTPALMLLLGLSVAGLFIRRQL
jgi:cytochrome c-type biogenesis protein CcmH